MRVEGASKAWRRAAHGIGFVLAVGHVAVDPVHAERVALVIGNAEYAESAARLTNPVRDAVAMAEMLDDLGFAVTLVENANIVGMDEAVNAFIGQVRPGDTAVFYYSGHGIELDTENYLLPVDFSSSYGSVLAKRRSTSASEVRDRMTEAGAEVRIVILDACRDNPFGGTKTFSRGGLGAMAASGGLVAFAAEPGKLASDNPGGENGLYTRELLRALEQPGVPANTLFLNVYRAVREASAGRQIPVYNDAGAGNFVFRVADPPDPDPDDCPSCPEMVVIPAGTFEMGSPASERGRNDDEGPQHRVTLKSFALGVTEVTFDEWDACVRGGGCGRYRPGDEGWGRGARPVINVSWNDAQTYVRWLSRETGESYRLPSEAEWEYAARGGTKVSRYWGDSSFSQCRHANGADAATRRVNSSFTVAACDDGAVRTAPVGSYSANGFGLFDVLGNAREWTEDCWHGNYRGAPRDGTAWTSGGECSRVLRGGSWIDSPRFLRSAVRYWDSAGDRNNVAGFRVARTLD